MKSQFIVFSLAMVAMIAMVGAQSARADDGRHHHPCHPVVVQNKPVVIDSCVMVTKSDRSATLGAANCTPAGDYPRWTCQFENVFYHENDTLYFPVSNRTVTQKTLEWLTGPFSAVGSTKEAAFNRLQSSFSNQLESQTGEPACTAP